MPNWDQAAYEEKRRLIEESGFAQWQYRELEPLDVYDSTEEDTLP